MVLSDLPLTPPPLPSIVRRGRSSDSRRLRNSNSKYSLACPLRRMCINPAGWHSSRQQNNKFRPKNVCGPSTGSRSTRQGPRPNRTLEIGRPRHGLLLGTRCGIQGTLRLDGVLITPTSTLPKEPRVPWAVCSLALLNNANEPSRT